MASNGSWASTAAVTALALAAAVPLIYLKYRGVVKQQDRQQALKLLRKVDLIVGEISVRLMHIENQVEDLLANDGRDSPASEPTQESTSNSTLNSYYHFDSEGNKLKTKWDNYDVDAELERLESDDESSATMQATSAPKTPSKSSKSIITKPKLLTAIGGIENEFEAVLEFLDDIRGDDVVKDTRKVLISKITTNQLARIDALRAALA